MHYLIDGYNLLFYLNLPGDNLQEHREKLISAVNLRAKKLNLTISIVFDATYSPGTSIRLHSDALEIIFTARGQTADEWIIDTLEQRMGQERYTLITQDKRLSWHARQLGASTLSTSDFLNWLEKRYNNLSKEKKKLLEPKVLPQQPIKKNASPTPQATVESCFDYYQHLFEERYKKMAQEKTVSPSIKRGKVKKKKDILKQESELSNQERWLRIFEERLGL